MNHSITDLVGETIGGWKLEELIGQGASGVVYRGSKDVYRASGADDVIPKSADASASMSGDPKAAAVKIYKPEIIDRYGEDDQLYRIRRQREFKDHGHPNLIRIFDGGQDEKTRFLYLVMEYMDAAPLDKVRKLIPVERIGPLIAQIARAAEFLEQHQLSHRDIKPANVVVDPGFRKATLLDLGVLRPLSNPKGGFDITDYSAYRPFVGTTRYSPIEFLRREEKDTPEGYRAITFYQLGAILHDLLTGKQMFWNVPDQPYAKLIDAIKEQNPPLLSSSDDLRPGVDQKLVKLAKDCLQKKWEDRCNSVKWEAFHCNRWIRRPTVIILYTGGTIGATVDDDRLHKRGLRIVDSTRHELLQRFHRRIVRDYTQVHRAGVEVPFDLVWEILPPEQQLLSENADPGTWNNLATAVERICHKYVHGPEQLNNRELEDCSHLFKIFEEENSGLRPQDFVDHIRDRYIAGLVILHGTDTLAYSAAALAFGLDNLPFPVVLTGSNQPPNENSILESDPVISKSDAWKNILRCLLFLHTFGHRFTEVFVCFGETIHHAVNLRKTAIDQIPLLQEIELRSIEEPYMYRNQSAQRQYMYRYIDGLYCNNFYPLQAQIGYKELYQTGQYRHARLSALKTEREIHRSKFSFAVRMVSTSPSFFFMDCSEALVETFPEPTQGLKVIVIEGYESGTFPTREGHSFTSLLKILVQQSIPIILISKNGLVPSQEPYETEKVDGQEVSVLRLFSIIAETAIPLVSLVLQDISEDAWRLQENEQPAHLVLRRLKLLEEGIRHWFSRPNILGAVLCSILDESAQRQWLASELSQEELDYRKRVENLFAEARGITRGNESPKPDDKQPFSPTTAVLHQHFLWYLLEIVRPFETARCGPDGFSFINDMGFYFGRQLLDSLISEEPPENKTLFAQQTEKENLIARAKKFTQQIANTLNRCGVADIKQETIVKSTDPSSISLRVNVRKHGRLVRADELFAVIGYRDQEAEFFRWLRKGCRLTRYEDECPGDIEQLYQELFATSWDARTCSLDWFLIGVFKGVLCAVLRDLVFDPWVQRCDSNMSHYVNALRQSVTTTVTLADEHALRVHFYYRARNIVPMPQLA